MLRDPTLGPPSCRISPRRAHALGLTLATLVGLWAVVARHSSAPPELPPGAHPFLRGERIDVNRASIELLQSVPGIGPATARRIVESRESSGPFLDLGQLVRVHGIGRSTIVGFEPFLTTSSALPAHPSAAYP